jgi:hypothetical protein
MTVSVLVAVALLRIAVVLDGGVAGRRGFGSGVRVFGRRGQRLTGIADAGERFRGFRNAAVYASIVGVDRAGVGWEKRVGGEEEDIVAVGRGIEESAT